MFLMTRTAILNLGILFLFQLKNHDSDLSEIKLTFTLIRTNANLAERNETYSKVRTFSIVSANLQCVLLSKIQLSFPRYEPNNGCVRVHLHFHYHQSLVLFLLFFISSKKNVAAISRWPLIVCLLLVCFSMSSVQIKRRLRYVPCQKHIT